MASRNISTLTSLTGDNNAKPNSETTKNNTVTKTELIGNRLGENSNRNVETGLNANSFLSLLNKKRRVYHQTYSLEHSKSLTSSTRKVNQGAARIKITGEKVCSCKKPYF